MTGARPSLARFAAGAAAVAALSPSVALACASCLFGAYGDRTFNWAFLGLIAMPFAVAGAIGAVLMHRYGLLRVPRGLRRAPAAGGENLAAHEETT